MYSYFTAKNVGRENSWEQQTETLNYIERNPHSRDHVCTLNVKVLHIHKIHSAVTARRLYWHTHTHARTHARTPGDCSISYTYKEI